MSDKEQVRLQVFVEKWVADRLDSLAETVGASRNDMAEWILEMGLGNEVWLAHKLGAWFSGKLLKATGKKWSSRNEQGKGQPGRLPKPA